jgi:hypothetical protein
MIWIRSKQLWKYITTTKGWINEKLQKDESIATSWWRALQWTNEDNENRFEDNVNDVWIDENIVVSWKRWTTNNKTQEMKIWK